MGKLKRLVGLILVLSLLSSFNTFAEETTLLPDGQAISIDYNTIDPRGYLIAARIVSIANNADGTMTVDAQIAAHVSLDYAFIRIYIDEYDEERDDWATVDYQDRTFLAKDYSESFMSSPGFQSTLEGLTVGKYYRVRGSFKAKKEGLQEGGSAETDGVLLTKVKK